MIETNKTIYVAKRYTPEPYWGCPRCGGNCWGAINPLSGGNYIYRCHGHGGVNMIETAGCGSLFTLPPEATEEFKREIEADGFTTADLD